MIPDPTGHDRDALAAVALALASLPRWSPTRRAVYARLGQLRTRDDLSPTERAAEAQRLVQAALRWRDTDQLARVSPPERPATLPVGKDPRPRPPAPTAPCRNLEELVNDPETLASLDAMLEGS